MSEKKFKWVRNLEIVAIYGCIDNRSRVRMQVKEYAKKDELFDIHDVMMEQGVLTDEDLGMKVTLTIEERDEKKDGEK